MKKVFSVLVVVGKKFLRGLKTFVTSPKHIAQNVGEEYKEAKFKPFGIFGGVIKGLFYMGADMGKGIATMATLNIHPEDYKYEL